MELIRHFEPLTDLATCIWMSRSHAVKASSGQKHVDAMRLAAVSPSLRRKSACVLNASCFFIQAMYANYDLERYVLRKVKGERGVTVEAWIGGEVSFADE